MKDDFENREAQIFLKRGRSKSLRNRHPWIFSGAVEIIRGKVVSGDIVSLFDSQGEFLAKGFVNLDSQIGLRALTFEDEQVDWQFFFNRIQAAAHHRDSIISKNTNACRLVNSEGDFLPGLIADKYDSALVVQFNSRGMNRLKSQIVEILLEIGKPELVVERTEGQFLNSEGLEESTQVLFGREPEKIQILENGVKFWVDITAGQKTGFFLDQRENRRLVAKLCSGKKLLNCFSYTGGFSTYAALEGAETTSVELSESAQRMTRENFHLNQIELSDHHFITADVFEFLRTDNDMYDAVVLDPPAFVKKKQHLGKGTRGYKDINRLAMTHTKNGGHILSCSCSNYVNWDLFQKIVFAAATEAKRNIQVISRFGAPPDHPFSIFHPEGEYLKSFLLRVCDL